MKKVKIYLFCKDKLVEWEINEFQGHVIEFVLDKSITMFSKNHYVCFESQNGGYSLKSTHDMMILYKDENVKSKVIEDGDVLVCNFPGENSKIVLFIQFESKLSHVFGKFSLTGLDTVSIGRSENNNIVYDNSNVLDYHVVLHLGRESSIEAVGGSVGCYVNGLKVNKSSIKFGDTIFLYGLKCVYLGKFIAVNDPNQDVRLNLPVVRENEIIKSLPRKFTNFKTDFVNVNSVCVDSDEDRNITINPPYIDLNFKFKFLYLGVVPFVFAAIVFLFLGMSYRDMKYMVYFGIASALISLVFLVCGIVLNRSKINHRIENYSKYLDGKFKKLTLIRDEKVRALSKRYPKVIDCYEGVVDFDKKLWNRNVSDKDFLNLIIGHGNVYFENLNVNSNVVSNLPEDHELYRNYVKVTNNFRVIRKAPITIPLRDVNKIAVIGDMSTLYDVVKNFLVQLTSLHSYRDLKIGVLNTNQYDDNLSYVKEIPHVYSENKDFRYISSNDEEMVDVIYNIKSIVAERESVLSQNPNQQFDVNYVIFIFYDFNVIVDSFLDYIKRIDNRLGISFILVTIHDKSIPDCFRYILDIKEETQTLYKIQDGGTKKLVLSHEYTDISNLIDIDKFVNELSKIKIFGSFEEIKKFEDKSMFNMYDISMVEQLNIMERWNKNNLVSLRDIPVGVKHDRGVFSINLHAKHNGPNGIIFGDSGTGKTEFLRTFILSYCVNFHPNSFNFIIIKSVHNIKLNSFANVPHVMDIINKENKSELDRLILLIKNEIDRRQTLFDSIKARDISDYLNFYKNYEDLNVLPHIAIVIDDVCSSDVKFIEDLTSLSTHMANAGIHVLVSTKDVDSFVDSHESILSRFNFKICFRISNFKYMVHLLEDNNISNPKGSGVFNVKFSDLSAVKDVEVAFSNVEQDIENSNENLDIINNCGLIIKKVSRVRYVRDSKIQQLAVMEKINELCGNIELNVTSIFNSSLRYLNLQQLVGYNSNFNGFMWCESQSKCAAIVGIIDDPKYNVQRFLEVNFEKFGNLFVYGAHGTGKSTLLKTLVYSLCCEYKPSYLNIYMVDANTRSSDCFGYAPHVKDIAYSKDEVNVLFKKVLDEFDLRRKIFENLDISSIENYKIKTGEQLPYIVLVIDSVQDISGSVWDYSNFIKMLARDGKSYGIFVCAVSSDYYDVEEKLSEYFDNKFVLRLSNDHLYRKILGEDFTVRSKLKGRGLVRYGDANGSRILEFQVAVPMNSHNEVDLNNKLKSLFMQMSDINSKIYESSYIGEMLDEYENYELVKDEDCKFLSDTNVIPLSQFVRKVDVIPRLISIIHDESHYDNVTFEGIAGLFSTDRVKCYLLDGTGGNFRLENSHWYSNQKEEILKTISWINDLTLSRTRNENFNLEYEDKLSVFIPALDNLCIDEIVCTVLESIFKCGKDVGIYFMISLRRDSSLHSKILDIVNSNPDYGMDVALNVNSDGMSNLSIVYRSEEYLVTID